MRKAIPLALLVALLLTSAADACFLSRMFGGGFRARRAARIAHSVAVQRVVPVPAQPAAVCTSCTAEAYLPPLPAAPAQQKTATRIQSEPPISVADLVVPVVDLRTLGPCVNGVCVPPSLVP